MNQIYPLKFKPQFLSKLWGGSNISKVDFLKDAPKDDCGEAWLLSGVENHQSVVANGFLEGNELNELVEVYMADLVGEEVFEKYGEVFPILIKMIDTNDWLSVQVHPDNELAMKNHGIPFGKTEMWYILKASENAALLNGFKKETNQDEIQKSIKNNKLPELLNNIKPLPEETYFTPARKIHALGPGLTLLEIQQTSDFTYRLYDWGRTDNNGNPRELHIDKGLDALNYEDTSTGKMAPQKKDNISETLVSCPEFVTNKINLKPNCKVNREYAILDSFVILIATKGNAKYIFNDKKETLNMGECVLVPACIEEISIITEENSAEILEIYIKI